MPQLVKGHLRYTDEDYDVQEFQEKAQTKFGAYSVQYLIELLRFESARLDNMKDAHITDVFDTSKNVKSALSNALLILNAIAKKEGLVLNDLM